MDLCVSLNHQKASSDSSELSLICHSLGIQLQVQSLQKNSVLLQTSKIHKEKCAATLPV